ncbi:MAG: metallophosphatase [Saprospiraceae bacterium]|nr:metallophosphatase [Saprospiraceae bacterium]MCB9319511.1 metallophosphatase [Lewinellaceae bacterium]
MIRRQFLRQSTLATGGLLWGNSLLAAVGQPEITKLTLLHTNDVHSRIDPFPMDGSRNQGQGGAARRAAMIAAVRAAEPNVLLVDAGDIFQGTPYFNFFKGELEMQLMSDMGYDAGTIGNHDFDAGVDGLAKQMPHANFPLLIANYDFRNTPMQDLVSPYKVFVRDEVRIGIFGLGIELSGLVPDKLFGETKYLDPVQEGNRMARLLVHEEKCDLVICLSHLGYRYKEEKVSDQILADQSENIDIIIGGHTHTFMDKPETRNNSVGKPVIINQVGWAGLILGRLDIYLEKNKRKHCVTCSNLQVA